MKSIIIAQKDTKMGRMCLYKKKDEKCLIPTSNCFCKDPHDTINSVKTCPQTEKQKITGWKSVMNYFKRESVL